MNKTSKEILSYFITVMKETLEKMIKEERQAYLEENAHTKANGYYLRNLNTPIGKIEGLRVARTRDGGFSSELLPYRKSYMPGFDQLIYALFYAGISTRKIGKVFEALYGMNISHTMASRLTKVAKEEIEKWKERPLEKRYPVIFVDGTYFPIKRGIVSKEVIYVILGIRKDGRREILAYDIGGEGESANMWKKLLREIKERGVEEVELMVGDGLVGLKEAIAEVYPKSKYQHCVLHAVKNTLTKVKVRDRSEIAKDLKEIYKARNKVEAINKLKMFRVKWCKKYPKIVKWWEEKADELLAFMEFPEEIRSMIYTTNSIERLFKEVKRRLKVMEVLQGEESAEKVLYVILRELNERLMSRKLKNFEAAMERYYENKHSSVLNVNVYEETQFT